MNWDLKVGRHFIHNKTYYRFQTYQDLASRPAPEGYITEKPSRGMVSLTTDLYTDLGEIEHFSGAEHVSLEQRLATLLHYTMGLVRYEVDTPQEMHRPFPSPRCLYASEMYVSIPADVLVEEGLYRYNPLHHALEKRRSTAGWQQIESALGISLAGAQGVLILGIDFWRIAHVYDDFALNLATIEAGHALGQASLMVRRLGWDFTIHKCFIDDIILSLLGMNEATEAPLAILVLWPSGARKIKREKQIQAPPLPPLPISQRFRREMEQCAEMLQMVGASRLKSNAELPARVEKKEEPKESKGLVPLKPEWGQWKRPNWLEVIKTRSSGNDRIGMMASHQSLSFGDLSKVLAILWEEDHPEWQSVLDDVKLFLLANRVADLRSGIYTVQGNPPSLFPLALGPMGEMLEELSIYSSEKWNSRSFPASIFLAVDYQAALERYGNRGFQVIQMRVGQISQYLALRAAAMGWFLRPLKSFYEAKVEHHLGLLSTDYTVAYQLVLGENKTPYLSFDLGL